MRRPHQKGEKVRAGRLAKKHQPATVNIDGKKKRTAADNAIGLERWSRVLFFLSGEAKLSFSFLGSDLPIFHTEKGERAPHVAQADSIEPRGKVFAVRAGRERVLCPSYERGGREKRRRDSLHQYYLASETRP